MACAICELFEEPFFEDEDVGELLPDASAEEMRIATGFMLDAIIPGQEEK